MKRVAQAWGSLDIMVANAGEGTRTAGEGTRTAVDDR